MRLSCARRFQSNLIRGKTNPDQIPDELALRLLLELNLTGNTSTLRAPQEQRMLRLMGFSESFLPQGVVILENYATKVRRWCFGPRKECNAM